MILKAINLANYRGFEQIDFKFHPIWRFAGVDDNVRENAS